ncbi:cellulose binding domain-containing protein [Plantactinospora siamensis]|uniref:Cellulose binding domain-containing protein n=1 Tax=Plantactinospora siamensis TaxID=555372 RepID=A0ABV6P0X1_9ACTN
MTTVSRRAVLAVGGMVAGAGLLAAVAMTPAVAGNGPAFTVPGGCTATAHIDSQWGSGTGGGQVVSVTVVNTSASAATTWTVGWMLDTGQRVVSSWNATVSTTGSALTATNTSYNGNLAPGAATRFGVQLAGTGPTPVPTCANDATPPTGSPTPPTGADVTVTQDDSQRTVTLTVGQTLGVSLPAEYVRPTVSNSALQAVSASGGYPTGQPLTAVFRAAAVGTADLTSHTDYPCLHTVPPCTVPIRLWTVHVSIVAPPPGTGQTVTVTAADNQKTVALRVGDTLVVSLPKEYQPTKVAPDGVLAQTSVSGGYPSGQPLVARYRASAAGTADLSTVTDADCMHQPTPCPTPSIPWKLHVTVTA